MHNRLMAILIVAWLWPCVTRAQIDAPDFEGQVAPLLATRCLECHSGPEPKGGLNLTTRPAALAGGESGAAIVPGNLEQSPLWQQVESDQMPPKKPLSQAEKALLKRWLASGAAWSLAEIDPLAYSSDARAGLDWWSLQPLAAVQPPSGLASHPIDAFVLERLQAAGLTASPRADKRTLIRRLSFDLLGLPPTPAQVDEFINDDSPQAYEHLVDRLLQSPHYGERWARHWLDIVRFGESNGFEYDEPRDNFWPYRNWVIQAFNDDLPYDEFVREQIAGDALAPHDYASAAATGFLVAGPHNTTLPSNVKMRMAMAQEEIEDLLGIVGQTFLGLTINCARCHDHKFDPISQQDYYQLAAALGGAAHGQRTITVPLNTEQSARLQTIKSQLAHWQQQETQLTEPVRQAWLTQRQQPATEQTSFQPPTATLSWEFEGDTRDSRQGMQLRLVGGAHIRDGALVLDGQRAYATSPALEQEVGEKTLEAWVQLEHLDQRGGGVMSLESLDGATFDAIVYGEQEARRWMAGSNNFTRTQSFQKATVQKATVQAANNNTNTNTITNTHKAASDKSTSGQPISDETMAHQRAVHIAIVYQADGTIRGYRDGQPYGWPYMASGLQSFPASAARLVFGLRHSPPGGNRMLAARIERAQFYDFALSDQQVALSAAYQDPDHLPRSLIVQQLSDAQRAAFEQAEQQLAQLESEQRAILASQQQTLYCCVSTKPPETRVLLRGDVGQPGAVVAPRGLRALRMLQPDWELDSRATDPQRRLKLAQWITDDRNPLLARVMVNRLWQYHFSRGLVATPSDFGFSGGQPSHPELLDWLAGQLVSHGYHVKAIQRLIVTSQTYQQSSAPRTAAMEIDADNQWLWRKTPQRVEAETLRDALLVVTGRLDRTLGGAGYRDMKHYFYKGSHFYDLLTETGSEPRRRTIYRFTPRGSTNPFLTTFDCPDPSATAPKRAVTTTPLQALALLNNAMIFQMADDLARQAVESTTKSTSLSITPSTGEPNQTTSDSTVAQIQHVYRAVYLRLASDSELEFCRPLVQKHGLAALCRVLFNSNEFLTVP